MTVIGLLGGVASGKSTVAELLRQLGAAIMDADRTGHEVLKVGHVKAAIRSIFGPAVFDTAGEVDRRALGRIVFASTPAGAEALTKLEQITHPEIGRRLLKEISERMTQGQISAIVLDAPVMLKAGWNHYCDQMIFVDAPEEVRLARAAERGWTEQEFRAREATQEPLSVKRQHASTVIDSGGTLEQTRLQVGEFWRRHVVP